MSKWIKCSERLPPRLKTVQFLYGNGQHVLVGFFDGEGRDQYDGAWYEFCLIDIDTERVELNPIVSDRITHWKQLSEPPEEEHETE